MTGWRLFAAVVGALPWRSLRALGAIAGWVAGSVLRIRRAHVHASMREAGIADVARASRGMYASLGASAFEFLWMSARGESALDHVRIAPASEASWSRLSARARGVVIAASHTGNWDLAACAIARRGPLLVVTKQLHSPGLDRFWQSTRAGRGVTLTPAAGAMSNALAALRAGGAVAMMIDQAPDEPGGEWIVPFLGRPARVHRAPAVLASRAGVPLVTAVALREDSGDHALHIVAVHEPPPRPDRAWAYDAMREATRALEAFVLANPTQWLWLHRRWKGASVDPRAGEAMLAPSCKTPSSSPATASRAA